MVELDISSTVEEFTRESTGGSVIDYNSVNDESGRSFQGFRERKYIFPH
jgi:hypothetical protein